MPNYSAKSSIITTYLILVRGEAVGSILFPALRKGDLLGMSEFTGSTANLINASDEDKAKIEALNSIAASLKRMNENLENLCKALSGIKSDTSGLRVNGIKVHSN